MKLKVFFTGLAISLFVCTIIAQTHRTESHLLPRYKVTNEFVTGALDSLISKSKKYEIPIFGEISFFQGKVSLISILTQVAQVRNYPNLPDIQNFCGVLIYDSVRWYIHAPVPISNVFVPTGDSIEACFCVEYVQDEATTIKRPCPYEMKDDMFGAVELFYNPIPQIADSTCIATNIRYVTRSEVDSLRRLF